MVKLTFTSLGFQGLKNIAEVNVDRDTKKLLPVEVSRQDEPIYKKYLIPMLLRYLQRGRGEEERVAAIAYLMDGSIEYAYNNPNGSRYVVTGGRLDPEFSDSDKCPPNVASNAEYARNMILGRKTEGIMLLQEVEGDDNSFRFRVVQDFPTDDADEINKIIEKTEGKAKKIALLESAAEYLQTMNGRDSFDEREIGEIFAIFNLLEALDPERRYVDLEDERFLGVGSWPMGRKTDEKKGTIIKFPHNQ